MSDDKQLYDVSRRKLLAGLGTVGAASAGAGLGTSALLWDEENFGSAENPNVLQAGALDLKVDWEGTYWNWKDNPTFSSDGLVQQPGPIIDFTDVKPGDVLEVTLSAHVFDNPAFLGIFYEEHADSDNGYTEPEDMVNGAMDSDDTTPNDGDLDDHMNVIAWYDDGDNVPQECYTGNLDLTTDDDGNLVNVSTEEYVMEIAGAQDPGSIFEDNAQLLTMGTVDDLDGTDFTLDSQVSVAGSVASDFPDSMCYQNSDTEYIGLLAWVPRDIPGVDDNIIQSDRLTFTFGFDAIQCRHNVADDGGPVDGNVSDADADSNASAP